MKYIIFSYDGAIFPIAKQLLDEGNDVHVCHIDRGGDLKVDSWINAAEDNNKQDRRMSLFDGILKKNSLSSTLNMMKSIKDKENYFIIFDYNILCKISENVLAMGFSNGHFPTTEDYNREKDRKISKDFVKANCPDLKLTDYIEMSSVDEVIKFLKSSKKLWCVKSNGNFGETIVPDKDNLEMAREQVISELNLYRKDYGKEKLILEEKLINPIELIPEIVFYNGKPVYSQVEIETRMFGAGDTGPQTGGNQNIVIRTDLNCRINKIAFPPAIYELAKNRIGVLYFDAGLLYDGKDFYFLEYAGNRPGWGGIFSEVSACYDNNKMSSNYYEGLLSGKNPYKYKYGSSVSVYSIAIDEKIKGGIPRQDIPIHMNDKAKSNSFLCQTKMNNGTLVNVGYRWLSSAPMGYMVGRGNSLNEAVDSVYKNLEGISLKGLYYRPKFDCLSRDYSSSIPNRHDKISSFITELVESRVNKLFNLMDV